MRKISIFAIFVLTAVMGWWIRAAEIHVTTTQDQVSGSLRAALTTANSNGEDNIIHLPAGTYVLSGTPDEDNNIGGDLDINTTKNLTIIGADVQTTIIDGNQNDRTLHVLRGVVSISGVTFQNGKTSDGKTENEKGIDGGGIYNSGNLSLSNCIINENKAGKGFPPFFNWEYHLCPGSGGNGGGIYNTGSLTLTHCSLTNNAGGESGGGIRPCSPVGSGGFGGGIFNRHHGSMVLDNCIIRKNRGGNATCPGDDWDIPQPGGDGGGIYNDGTQQLTHCTIEYNTSGYSYNGPLIGQSGAGGGIYNTGDSFLNECIIRLNSTGVDESIPYYVTGKGGGIYNSNYIILTDCAIMNNHTHCGGAGGGIYNEPYSWETSGFVSLNNCTISDNYTGNGEYEPFQNGGNGGGIFSSDMLHLTNCTVTNNYTGNGREDDEGNGGNGGGIYTTGYYCSLTNCTICKNYTSAGIEPGSGGGIYIANSTADIKNTILANNRVYSGGKGPDCFGSFKSVGYNLIRNTSDCTITGTVTGNITGVDPKLGPLADNGGPTKTCALLTGSPAIDAGYSKGITEDQRHYPRPFDMPGIRNIKDGSDIGAYEVGVPYVPPKLSLSRTHLNFGAIPGDGATGSQTFSVSNSGGGVLDSAISANVSWLSCTPASIVDSGVVNVTVSPTGLIPGIYTGVITIEDTHASNSPQTVNVTLNVYDAGSVNPPFGSFDTPINGATVYGSVPVTGWALDNIAIESVKIFRDPVQGEGSGLVYISNATFVEGARPDVETAFPDYPDNYKAGWGYMLLTNALPDQGNGAFTIYAIAEDIEGNVVTLGTKTIHSDNAHAVKPFGAIDTPQEGGTVSGSEYLNFGWALTPLPNTIPIDGSTIFIWVDGKSIGRPVYNQYRADIAALFPGYNNTNGAVGYYYLDTTKYKNGVHTIAWTVKDNAENEDGIGSRYITVQNSIQSNETISNEFNNDINMAEIITEKKEGSSIQIKELERVKINLPQGTNVEGYLVVGDRLKALPIGSTLDKDKGVFYWQPGPGFIGAYEFVFVIKGKNGVIMTKRVTVKINPKFPYFLERK